jgi:hypothetical protein
VEAVEATTAPPQPLLLPSEPDRYGGVLVDSSALPSDASQFQQVRAFVRRPCLYPRPQLNHCHPRANRCRRGVALSAVSPEQQGACRPGQANTCCIQKADRQQNLSE